MFGGDDSIVQLMDVKSATILRRVEQFDARIKVRISFDFQISITDILYYPYSEIGYCLSFCDSVRKRYRHFAMYIRREKAITFIFFPSYLMLV